jgi:hypothetical protein
MKHFNINFFNALLPFFVKPKHPVADTKERIRRKSGGFARYIPYSHGRPQHFVWDLWIHGINNMVCKLLLLIHTETIIVLDSQHHERPTNELPKMRI